MALFTRDIRLRKLADPFYVILFVLHYHIVNSVMIINMSEGLSIDSEDYKLAPTMLEVGGFYPTQVDNQRSAWFSSAYIHCAM